MEKEVQRLYSLVSGVFTVWAIITKQNALLVNNDIDAESLFGTISSRDTFFIIP